MNNYILISKTYSETTPESLEDGDFSSTGFVTELEQVTFSELVKLMIEHYEECKGIMETWFSTNWYTECYKKGIERQESIHFHRDNTENAGKYWLLARKFADKKLKHYSTL